MNGPSNVVGMGHPRYLTRLGEVYITKYRTAGEDEAKKWYYEFVPIEHQAEVSEAVHIAITKDASKKKP